MAEIEAGPAVPRVTEDAAVAASTPEQRAALRAQLKSQEMANYKAMGYSEEEIRAKLEEVLAGGVVPTVTEIDPTTAVMGGPDLTLTVYGTGFTGSTEIAFNFGVEPTTFVSETEVTTGVKPSTVAAPVIVSVSVVGAAESVPFEFTEPVP